MAGMSTSRRSSPEAWLAATSLKQPDRRAALQRIRSFTRRRRTHAVSRPATIDLLGSRIERTAGLKIAAVIRVGLARR